MATFWLSWTSKSDVVEQHSDWRLVHVAPRKSCMIATAIEPRRPITAIESETGSTIYIRVYIFF